MAGFTREGAGRVVRATQLVEQQYGVRPSTHYRRRFPRGDSGSSLVYGQLIDEIPANSILEDECLELEDFNLDDSEWFSFTLDDDLEKVVIWAANPSLNSAIRGSVDHPLRVFGEIFTVERTEGEGEEEVTVTKDVFLILGHQDPLVGAHGFVVSPDNDKGQALIHHDGVAATAAAGGPCGGE